MQNKFVQILTPNANGINHRRADSMYVRNKFACIVLRKQRRSLENNRLS